MILIPAKPPFAFLLKTEEPYTSEIIGGRLREFGIASEGDPGTEILALPCHSGMTARHVEYIFGAFRGMVNPCYTFVRTDPSEGK